MAFKEIYQALSDKRDINTTVFKKEFTETPPHIQELEKLLEDTNKNVNKELVEQHLQLFRIGLIGERNVTYELKNSMLPMICLHDIQIDHEGYTAQFDFIVVTHSVIFIIETKKLFGDIEVNKEGNFIRKIKNKYGKVIKKEGMYSPVTQSQRHARILDKLLKDNNLISKTVIEPIVVMANPKSIIEKKSSPKEIQDSIIKSDQLVTYLSSRIKKHRKQIFMLDKYAEAIANFILEKHNSKPLDRDKYLTKEIGEDIPLKNKSLVVKEAKKVKTAPKKNRKNELVTELKQYRLSQSKKDDVKAYFIFNNVTLDSIVEEMPGSLHELQKIRGFGEVKAQKYGPSIIEIVNKYK